MADAFIGEIRLFAGSFAPLGWAFCNGQVLNIRDCQALFAVIGTLYGGNGTTTFALPDLQGRVPMHRGAGPGLTPREISEKYGSQQVTLREQQMAAHTHTARGAASVSTQIAAGAVWGASGGRGSANLYADGANTQMNQVALGNVGSGAPHNNMQPYLPVNFIIALEGIFPPRD